MWWRDVFSVVICRGIDVGGFFCQGAYVKGRWRRDLLSCSVRGGKNGEGTYCRGTCVEG
jgi:hypothetical protein